MRSRAEDLVGILNGVDYEEWDPRHDPHLAASFDEEEHAGKIACKRALLLEYGLSTEPDVPLIGIVSRLVHQKGFDLVAAALEPLLARRLRMVVLGTGEPDVEEGLREFVRRDPTAVRRSLPLRHRSRPPDRGGRRHDPDAFEVRALRSDPDVQHALRHHSDSPGHRRPRRHDSTFRPQEEEGDGIPLPSMPTSPASSGRSTRPSPPTPSPGPGRSS